MPRHNKDIAKALNDYADLLEIREENVFRVRAYRNAARAIENHPESLQELRRRCELTSLAGIGKDLAGKIESIIETGSFPELDHARAELPGGLSELLQIAGLGPRRVQVLHRQLGISSRGELAEAAKAGKLRSLRGFGEKTEEHILSEIEHTPARRCMLINEAAAIADALLAYLKSGRSAGVIEAAGSLRRKKETIGDLDILAASSNPARLMDRFCSYEDIGRIAARGATKSTILLTDGVQVDLRVVPPECFGAALHYFTGSKAHNIRIRQLGQRRNLKISEYGVFREERLIAGAREEDVFAEVGLPFIAPELREDTGEIEAAQENLLPVLIAPSAIRGDLHCHTKHSDGHASIEEMALAAKALGYEYMAITDHTRSLGIARGLDARRLARQMKEIDEINARLAPFVLLKGAEVDILADGSLDLPPSILKQLDLTVCSIHSRLNLPAKEQTKRMISAVKNPLCTILGHPTGRLLNRRAGSDLDLEAIIAAAADCGCLLEINAQPSRLDLPSRFVRLAGEHGVRFSISTDAHSPAELNFMSYGVSEARRGWVGPQQVLNTLPLGKLQEALRSRH